MAYSGFHLIRKIALLKSDFYLPKELIVSSSLGGFQGEGVAKRDGPIPIVLKMVEKRDVGRGVSKFQEFVSVLLPLSKLYSI